MKNEKNTAKKNETVRPEPQVKVRAVPRTLPDGRMYYEYEYYYEA